jgi:hypothetical protein
MNIIQTNPRPFLVEHVAKRGSGVMNDIANIITNIIINIIVNIIINIIAITTFLVNY